MENFKLQLLKEFENMRVIPIFNIDISDSLSPDLGIEEEYYIFYLQADIKGISAGHMSNCGFYQVGNLFIEWDEFYSLDEHLFYFYEMCRDWAIEDFEKSLEK